MRWNVRLRLSCYDYIGNDSDVVMLIIMVLTERKVFSYFVLFCYFIFAWRRDNDRRFSLHIRTRARSLIISTMVAQDVKNFTVNIFFPPVLFARTYNALPLDVSVYTCGNALEINLCRTLHYIVAERVEQKTNLNSQWLRKRRIKRESELHHELLRCVQSAFSQFIKDTNISKIHLKNRYFVLSLSRSFFVSGCNVSSFMCGGDFLLCICVIISSRERGELRGWVAFLYGCWVASEL